MTSVTTRRRDLWPLALLILAALLRFSYLSEIEHNVDHAYPIWQALRTLEHGVFPFVGQGTSVLFANPALTGYLYLPVVALTRSPMGAYLLVIALNSLAVPLAYRAISLLRGRPAGLMAAALLAVNPWVIEYSRATWVQSLLPFFACLLAWLLWPVLLGRSRRPARRLLLALIALTLMTQTYLLAFLMIGPVGLLLLIFRRRVPLRALLLGGAVLAAASVIYGAGLLNTLDTVQQEVSEFAAAPARISPEAWNHAVRLISGADYPLARGQQAPAADAPLRQTLTQAAHGVVLVALLAGLALALWAIHRGPGRDAAVMLLVWFGLPVLLMSYVGQQVHPFYLLLTLPAGHALVGWAFASLPGARLRTAAVALMVPFAALMVVNSQRFAQETAAFPGAHDLGALPLDYGIELGRRILSHLPDDGIVYAEVDEWTLNSLAGTTFPLLRDTRAPGFSIVPRAGGVYVFPHANLPADWQGPLYTTTHEQMRLPDGVTLTLDAYPPGAVQQVSPQVRLDQASEDGLTLLGYDLILPGDPGAADGDISAAASVCPALAVESLRLTTYWRVEALPDGAERWYFAPFVQAFSMSGELLNVIQGAMVPGREWQVGDVHIHRMLLPPDTSLMRIGQFDGSRQRNLIFLPDYTPLIDLPVRP
jgi:4-amino-4-deoxy-L-arabinose transferase-like glycosyltransferase